MTLAIILLLSGFFLLIKGANYLVEGSSALAKKFSISEIMIGLTIVAVGTSLPELFTSAIAAKKGKADLAIGNVVGSNIFNIFFVLGLSTLIAPVSITVSAYIDLWVLVFASSLLFLTMFTGKHRSLDRWEAILFLIFFGSYLTYLIIKG